EVAPSTASSHLAKLLAGGLVALARQGRHRYFRLAGPEAAAILEGLGAFATAREPASARPLGTADPALRAARLCYDHLAGALGVRLFDDLRAAGFLDGDDGGSVTAAGASSFAGLGIDLAALRRARRAFARPCLDWTERRPHLGGALGAAL